MSSPPPQPPPQPSRMTARRPTTSRRTPVSHRLLHDPTGSTTGRPPMSHARPSGQAACALPFSQSLAPRLRQPTPHPCRRLRRRAHIASSTTRLPQPQRLAQLGPPIMAIPAMPPTERRPEDDSGPTSAPDLTPFGRGDKSRGGCRGRRSSRGRGCTAFKYARGSPPPNSENAVRPIGRHRGSSKVRVGNPCRRDSPHRQIVPDAAPHSDHHVSRVPAQDSSLLCTVCLKRFGSLSTFNHHRFAHHDSTSGSPAGPHFCAICDKEFTCWAEMRLHLEAHLTLMSRACS